MEELNHEDNTHADGGGAPAEAPEGANTQAVPPMEAPGESPNTAGVPMSAFRLTPEQYWGIDLSYDHVTVEEAQRVYDAGVAVAFQCLWTGRERPATAENNIRNLASVGVIVCGYVSTSAGHTGLWHVQQGYDTLAEDVKRLLVHVATDIELEGLQFQTHVVDCVDALRNRGYRPLLYTSYNAWVNMMGNPPIPKSWRIWNAFWDNDSDFDFERFPYGGADISMVIGEQFTGGEDVVGIFADRNIFKAEFFASEEVPVPVPPVPGVPSIEEYALASASLVHLERNGQRAALAPQDIAAIKAWAAVL